MLEFLGLKSRNSHKTLCSFWITGNNERQQPESGSQMTKRDQEQRLQNNDIFDKSITLVSLNYGKSSWRINEWGVLRIERTFKRESFMVVGNRIKDQRLVCAGAKITKVKKRIKKTSYARLSEKLGEGVKFCRENIWIVNYKILKS